MAWGVSLIIHWLSLELALQAWLGSRGSRRLYLATAVACQIAALVVLYFDLGTELALPSWAALLMVSGVLFSLTSAWALFPRLAVLLGLAAVLTATGA